MFKFTQEESLVFRLKGGHLQEADFGFSALYRDNLPKENINSSLLSAVKNFGFERTSDPFTIFYQAQEIIDKVSNDPSFILTLFLNSGLNTSTSQNILRHWMSRGSPNLKQAFPYSVYCLTMDLYLLIATAYEVIPSRPTNLIDLQYLYYLPFCQFFTSSDKLHRLLVPPVLRKDQQFIPMDELKEDLSKINKSLENADVEGLKKYKYRPPLRPDSTIVKMWDFAVGYNESNQDRFGSSPELKEEILSKAKQIFKAANDGEGGMKTIDGIEYQARYSYLSKDDDCFCGSGKSLIDCCIPPEEFARIAVPMRKAD